MKYEDENVCQEAPAEPNEIAAYIIQTHGGDAVAAVEILLDEIEHLQTQLSIAVTAMGKGYTRGWMPNIER
ncbi:hypothetical protein [Rhizobium oryziradicis]|uniref:Dehydrogenase n=1 Tax=Rhizobium oryziradicis TaxID=1867956 RepID=A0A1Q8ZQ10_9HYPH|nr:hypothetical protein [Rhizobium oryziradicis]OLP44174.1 hypothetical protein BJF95_06325 [Rhizobium oryziradicis]